MKINIIKTDRVLSPTSINLADYVINPFRGCEFGCVYCYSKNNKNMTRRKDDWGSFVDVKINCMEVLEKEIKIIKNKNIKVLLGSITEIFQPVEKKFHLTENILRFLKKEKILLTILTKSTLIKEYMDLINYSNKNTVYFTYNSAQIKKLFEKKTPDNKERLKIMKMILENNIRLSVYISPFMPFISDYKTIMDDLSILPDKGFDLYFEGYNMQMGNWKEVKKKIPGKLLDKYNKIYSNKKNYNRFGKDIRESILEYNKRFNYKIKFFNYPYNDYYRNEL